MELPSKIKNNKKSLQQGIPPIGNGDLIPNRKFTELVVDSDPFIQIFHKAILKSLGVKTQFFGKWDRFIKQ